MRVPTEHAPCECGAHADYVCQQCRRTECLRCRCQYAVVSAVPALCWRCQNEADQEWLRSGMRGKIRTTPRKERRNA